MNNKCPKCGCKEIVLLTVFRGDGSNSVRCAECGYNWFFPPQEQTVFEKITQSPKVLAEKLVYRSFVRRRKMVTDGFYIGLEKIKIKCWKSTVIPGEHYKNKAQAIAATVAKLKEVAE